MEKNIMDIVRAEYERLASCCMHDAQWAPAQVTASGSTSLVR